ncbi:MAG: transcription-repair coupling factor [Lentisphaeria bacterium]|nr:transcription-repair coupling factor [Lentisphaeria bacterium]
MENLRGQLGLLEHLNHVIEHFEFGVNFHWFSSLEVGRSEYVPEHECRRSRILLETSEKEGIFLATADELIKDLPAPQLFRENFLKLERGSENQPPQKLVKLLTKLDYDNEAEVHLPGEFSWRGGILDIFSPAHRYPFRLDYWGDEIESIRFFDPQNQCSLEEVTHAMMIPRGETNPIFEAKEKGQLLDYFGEDVTILYCCSDISSNAEEEAMKLCEQNFKVKKTDPCPDYLNENGFGFEALSENWWLMQEDANRLVHEQVLIDELKRLEMSEYQIFFTYRKESTLKYLESFIQEKKLTYPNIYFTQDISLPEGLLLPKNKIAIFTEAEIFGRSTRSRPPVNNYFQADHAFHEQQNLLPGEFAVHAGYGICRYIGVRMVEDKGKIGESMVLEFEDEMEMLVPLDQAHLVSRYVSTGKAYPKLSKVGTSTWKTKRNKTENALKDFAAEMLRIQAVRKHVEGFRFVGSEEEQALFDQAFPYTLTKDQETVLEDVYRDMEAPRPMDRLVCGDVGFGKTEIAMRAIFKAISSGKQTALLVPTTFLAEQHYFSFKKRFEDFPIVIEVLSRFKSAKEQRAILERVASGGVDILIGTHRILSKDVSFPDLGLITIDEEQRFGVEHKEKLKQMRANVDVLTLSATPIPRTLYFSVAGLRDISTIATPPLARLPVQTTVCKYDREVIKTAIQHELDRLGQVYYLHNRVKTIHEKAAQIKALFPSANIQVAHGQMSELELEPVLLGFFHGDVDILVCTTIIESGMDVSNANTMMVEDAHRFGLAELYQIRGRVGRHHRQAYAYLFVPGADLVTGDARKRLHAIRKYTQLGAGFKLALKDLEIRGSGNIIGKEQSGYISTIGFDLYCKILKEAVKRLKGQKVADHNQVVVIAEELCFGISKDHNRISLALSPQYITDEQTRINLYRRLGEISSQEELNQFETEIGDRFGKPDEPAQNLIELYQLKFEAHEKGIHTIKVFNGHIQMLGQKGLLRIDKNVPKRNPRYPIFEQLFKVLRNPNASFR